MIPLKTLIQLMLLTVLPALAGTVHAVLPPTLPAVTGSSLKFDWVLPETRASGAPLALSEIRAINLYVESLPAAIQVMGAVTTHTYVLPAGVCIKPTDRIFATATDIGGLESAASAPPTYISEEVCGPKARPAAPATLKATAVKSSAK